MRAQRLARRGLVHWLHPDGLTPRVVAGAIAYVADAPRHELLAGLTSVRHTGVHTTARLLSGLLSEATSFPVAEHASVKTGGVR
jgi:predicted glycosyltransferase